LNPISSVSNVSGRLSKFKEQWEAIGASSSVLAIIQGYEPDFKSVPVQGSHCWEHSLSDIESSQMGSEIESLLIKGAIVKCDPLDGQFLSSYFLVPKANNEYRFVFNLKNLNTFIQNSKFKMENFKSILNLINRNDFLGSIDLLDAYFQIPIAKHVRKFFRFLYNGQTFEFTCLPFGLSTAPRIFTKVMKPVVQYLRSRGYRNAIYLDDLLCMDSEKTSCDIKLNETVQFLESLGFLINQKKSMLVSFQRILYLGFIIDTAQYQVELPAQKKINLTDRVNSILLNSKISIQDLSELVGTLVSYSVAIKYGMLYTKQLERDKFLALKKSANDYCAQVKLSSQSISDLYWWLQVSSKPVKNIPEDTFSKEIFSDASLSGWGAACGPEHTGGIWPQEFKSKHINELELIAAFYAMKCYARGDNNASILLRIDNVTAVSCVNKMGGIQYPHLMSITREIWKLCERQNLYIYASYIRSKENAIADMESRKIFRETEWSLSNKVYGEIISLFGTPEIDLFASQSNFKCAKYISWKPDPLSYEIDAFTISWFGKFTYIFPSFNMLSRVLKKLQTDKATGIVVAPFWESQPWFPLFMKLSITKVVKYGPINNLLSFGDRLHPLRHSLILMASTLSGNLS